MAARFCFEIERRLRKKKSSELKTVGRDIWFEDKSSIELFEAEYW